MQARSYSISPYLASVAKRTVLAFFSLLLLLVITVALAIAFADLTGYAGRSASDASGREIGLGEKAEIDWGWVPKITLTNVTVANMESASEPVMFTAQKIVISLDVRQLLKGDTYLPEVVLEKPDLLLEKDGKGKANWDFSDNADAAATAEAVTPDSRTDIPAIGRLVVREGRLRYKDPTDKKVDIDSKISTATGAAQEDERIELKGTGRYQGQAFSMNLSGGSILTLQDDDTPYPLDLDLRVGDTSFQVKGTVQDPVQLKGLDLALRVKGATMSDLFPITGIALPPTPPYDVAGQLGYEDHDEAGIWTFKDFKGRMGGSDLNGDLTWDTTKKRPLFTANFVSKRLAFEDLGGLVGAPPKDKAVDPEQKQEARKQEASGRVLPDVALDISRLKAMDANVTFTGKQVVSTSLPLDDFYMKVTLDNSFLAIDPVKFGTAGGNIDATLSVNARKEPVMIDSDFRFRKLSLARLFAPLAEKLDEPNLAKGYIGGRAKLAGTGKSLRDMLATSDGTVGIGMEGGQLSNLVVEFLGIDVAESVGFLLSGDKPTKIRCVIGDFGVADGRMKSNTLVIDTHDTNVGGEGSINLKDETMDLKFTAHPKDPSFLSARAPIRVRGTLKSPRVGVDAAALAARGGVVAALSVVLTPIGGLLGFIEPGLGKDSDCAGLLTEMRGNTKEKGEKDLVPVNEKATPAAPEETKTPAMKTDEPSPEPGRTPEPQPGVKR